MGKIRVEEAEAVGGQGGKIRVGEVEWSGWRRWGTDGGGVGVLWEEDVEGLPFSRNCSHNDSS